MIQYTGKQYLQIDIGSHFGSDGMGFLGDKDQFENRIQWVEDHEHELEALEDQADDMFRYAGAVKAYRKGQQGIPSGYRVGLDACASGPALLSILTGCATGAANTGCTGKIRKDVYGIVTEVQSDTLQEAMVYKRSEVKQAFMPFFYGSTAEPERIYGEDTTELAAFYEATDIVCPGASRIMPIIQNMWDLEALKYETDFPDGFHSIWMVKEKVDDVVEIDTIPGHPTFTYRHTVNTPIEYGLFLAANFTHGHDGYMVREITARCDYDSITMKTAEALLVKRLKKTLDIEVGAYTYMERMWRKHAVMSIEGVEHCTYWSVDQLSNEYCTKLLSLVREVRRHKPCQVTSVHDEYTCLANHMNTVRHWYIEVLAELAEGNTMNAILSDIAGYPVNIEKMTDNLGDLIRQSEYSIA